MRPIAQHLGWANCKLWPAKAQFKDMRHQRDNGKRRLSDWRYRRRNRHVAVALVENHRLT
jgi:hypothetical protein